MDSLPNSGLAHPPRSNPTSSTLGPPFACITPSTETCMVVVSFMIAVPFSLGAPHGRPLTPATNASVPIRHRLADFFRGLSGTPVVAIRQRGGMILIEGRVDNRAFQGQVVGGSRPDDWPRPLGLEDVAPAPADATVASTAETAAPTSGPRV